MARPKKPLKVKLIIGFLFTSDDLLEEAKHELAEHFGKIDKESAIFPFDFTTFYEAELGKNIKRQYISFEKHMYPEDMVDIKLYTNFLEEKLSKSEKRKINIDPGYVDLSKLILMTTKDATYRTYLNYGIYAQSTLFFQEKTFHPWEWTYADYKVQTIIDFFTEVRNCYKEEMLLLKAKRKGFHFGFKGIVNNRVFILFMLFFALGPFAIPWLWQSARFKRFTKIVLTVAVSIFTVYLTYELALIIQEYHDLIKRLVITYLKNVG